jgi:hypothetical protein
LYTQEGVRYSHHPKTQKPRPNAIGQRRRVHL